MSSYETLGYGFGIGEGAAGENVSALWHSSFLPACSALRFLRVLARVIMFAPLGTTVVEVADNEAVSSAKVALSFP
jgi:hypothetical protein